MAKRGNNDHTPHSKSNCTPVVNGRENQEESYNLLFYKVSVEVHLGLSSVLLLFWPVRYGDTSGRDRRHQGKVVRTATKITDPELPSIAELWRDTRLAQQHIFFFNILPFLRRKKNCRTRTVRFGTCPEAICPLNTWTQAVFLFPFIRSSKG